MTSMFAASRPRAIQKPDEGRPLVTKNWTSGHSYVVLAALTLTCLVPFSGKPFHVDDPLFVWTAQQIVQHPLDPYGFRVVWYTSSMPASEVVKNPPLASYYMAGIGMSAGWSERSLHVGFLLPALVVVLGTYYLASRCTQNPLLAGAATLLTPGFLVSSTNVMCDTMMLAVWILAIILWVEGLDRAKPLLLAGSALFISLCALTKYFGMALVPLLMAYSVARKRRFGSWAVYLLIPLVLLAAYQYWTRTLYGKGLLADAAGYAHSQNIQPGDSRVAKTVVGFGFVGGCALTGLTYATLLWSRRKIFLGLTVAGLAGVACAEGWIPVAFTGEHWNWVCTQLAFFVFGCISILALPIADWWKQKDDPQSLLLALWVVGTFVFAVFVNWTVNARSVLPLIPAVGILLARRVDPMTLRWRPRQMLKLLVPLAVAGIASLWITWADAQLADTARLAARHIQEKVGNYTSRVSFEGHWGFQYYMQSFGFRPVDFSSYDFEDGNLVVLPGNNDNVNDFPPEFIASRQVFKFDMKAGAATIQSAMGAGFYSDVWGPLPYAFGPVPPENYSVVWLTSPPPANLQP